MSRKSKIRSPRALIMVPSGKKAREHKRVWGHAFADGLRRHGWLTKIDDTYEPSELIVTWGVRRQGLIKQARQDECEICILERGYVGDRKYWTSVSFGGELNGRATFYVPNSYEERWSRLFSSNMSEFKIPDNGYALVIGQVKNDMSVRHEKIENWYKNAYKILKRKGWDVAFRAHPAEKWKHKLKYTVYYRSTRGPLKQAIDGAKVVVTFNSNTGVDAVLQGRPVIACDRGSMVWPISGHTLDEIVVPNRQDWANKIAWCQYSFEEITSGWAWDMVSQARNMNEFFIPSQYLNLNSSPIEKAQRRKAVDLHC